MKIKKLGEDLYEVTLPFWAWSYAKALANALLEIQSRGKTVTAIRGFTRFIRPFYLVCTTNK